MPGGLMYNSRRQKMITEMRDNPNITTANKYHFFISFAGGYGLFTSVLSTR